MATHYCRDCGCDIGPELIDGANWCADCKRKYQQEYRKDEVNRERIRQYYWYHKRKRERLKAKNAQSTK